MASDENAFFGLKVPEGTDRRELYKSQYRAIYTYKMSAAELDQAFREAVTGDGPDGGWSIKNDERVKYVGKLEVQKGEESTLKVRANTRRATRPPTRARARRSSSLLSRASPPPPAHAPHALARSLASQVTMEDYPEAGMSALKYYTIQSYTK